jgi:prolyl oligopeptidase
MAALTLGACASPPGAAVATPARATSAAPAPAPTAAAPGKLDYPLAERRPVAQGYGPVNVVDDYQWLENGADPHVVAWSAEERALTRGWLDAIPSRTTIHERVKDVLSGRPASYGALVTRRGGRAIFAVKVQPPRQQPFIVALASLEDTASERVVLDPNAIDPSGKTSIDYWVPSPDGTLVAASLSVAGTESGEIHVLDVATGKPRPDVVPRANSGTAGGSLAWTGDGSGFYFTRHPHDGERPREDLGFYQQVYLHKLGTPPERDVYALGKDGPRIAEWKLAASDDGKHVLAVMRYGDGGEQDVWVGTGRAWEKVADKADSVRDAAFGKDGKLYVVSRAGAPHGRVLRVEPGKADAMRSAVEILPESDAVIEHIALTRSRLYAVDLVGGPSQVRYVPLVKSGRGAPQTLATPPVSTVSQIVALDGDDVAFRSESYTEAPAWMHHKAADGTSTRTALAETPRIDFGDVEVVRETCTSKDGTKVPLSVMRRKGAKLDGQRPTLLTGYGGYGISVVPHWKPVPRVWLDQGGVWAEANLRGGGEMGEAWHHAGSLTNKQNVFDDFAACAEALVASGYTRAGKLAIMGGSNGGLLMGAALTQHPSMFRAVVSMVGIYDSLRAELAPNGAFNVTEMGTVKDPAQRDALLAYSPYHHVETGVAYPSVLFMTGENDPRVSSWHSRKMTARLQAATSSPNPILLRTNDSTGHIGTPLSAQIEQTTDLLTFLFHELGVDPVLPGTPAP